MIKALVGERFDRVVEAALAPLLRYPLNPNALTVAGTLVSLGAAAALATGRFALGGGLIILGGFFDLVDGVVARKHGRSTAFGAFLDSSLDRLVDMALLLGVMMHFALVGEPGHVLLAGYALVAAVMVSYTKASAERVLSSFRGGVLERAERIVLLALGGLLDLIVPALWLIAIGSTVTVVQRFSLAYRKLARVDASTSREVGEHP